MSSPVLEQRVLWNLVVGHRLPEGVDLLQDELSDLGHGLVKPQAHTFQTFSRRQNICQAAVPAANMEANPDANLGQRKQLLF